MVDSFMAILYLDVLERRNCNGEIINYSKKRKVK